MFGTCRVGKLGIAVYSQAACGCHSMASSHVWCGCCLCHCKSVAGSDACDGIRIVGTCNVAGMMHCADQAEPLTSAKGDGCATLLFEVHQPGAAAMRYCCVIV